MINPFTAIAKWWTKTFQRFSSLPFLFILIAIEVYLYVNGAAHFSEWIQPDGTKPYKDMIQVYLIMTIVFLFWSSIKTKERLNRPLKDSALAFVIFFIGTYVILLLISALNIIGVGASNEDFWLAVIMQVCVVATSEELMFRGVVLDLTGVIISSLLFAAWHMWAYQIIWYGRDISNVNWGAVIFAFVMGLILALVAKRKEWGLPASIGIHSAYNCFVIGIFVSL